MAETGSTRVRRRINTLFASNLDHQRTKGGRRVPHSAAPPPYPPKSFSHSRRGTVHRVTQGAQYVCVGQGEKATVQS